jgi:hypothetical protein
VEVITGLDNGAQVVRTNLGNLPVGTQVKFAVTGVAGEAAK